MGSGQWTVLRAALCLEISTFLIAIESVTSFALLWVTPGIFAWTLATSTKLRALSLGQ